MRAKREKEQKECEERWERLKQEGWYKSRWGGDRRPASAKPSNTELYDTLGVDVKASQQEIKAAYRSLIRKIHPDKVDGKERAEANERAQKINYAFEVLGNEYKREAYDQGEDYTYINSVG